MLEKGAGEARRGKVLSQTKRTANKSLLASQTERTPKSLFWLEEYQAPIWLE